MKVFMMDTDGEGMGVDLAFRASEAGHDVRYWVPKQEEHPYGKNMLERPIDWEPSMDWAELIILTGNSTYSSALVPYFGRGYPIFGTNPKAAELELDRGVGQEVLKKYGIDTAPYRVVNTVDDAIRHVVDTNKPYAMKPWGGEADKAMTYVAREPRDAIFTLEKWKREGLFKGSLMMQEKVDGVEMGIAGWFGPGGWNTAVEESFEHKKFLNDDLGENTGEMGTIIRHVKKSKLFDLMLEPLTDYLHMCHYVGDCSVNCIIDKKGTPWPLEFTMRLGWPDFCIRQEVIKGDPVEWMLGLLYGQDTLEVSSAVAAGVLMAHGDFPKSKDPSLLWAGYPIYGITAENKEHLHFQQVQVGKAPELNDGRISRESSYLTAGSYVLVAGGSGPTVKAATEAAYGVAWDIKWPGNLMMRTDIGKRLKKDLPLVQRHGFAEGMKYD